MPIFRIEPKKPPLSEALDKAQESFEIAMAYLRAKGYALNDDDLRQFHDLAQIFELNHAYIWRIAAKLDARRQSALRIK